MRVLWSRDRSRSLRLEVSGTYTFIYYNLCRSWQALIIILPQSRLINNKMLPYFRLHKFCSSKAPKSSLDTLYEMSKKTRTPFFTVQSHHIEIINDPLEFYLALHNEAKKVINRVGLSSLYLGTGPLQRFLLNSIVKRVKTVPSLDVRMVFDYNRSLREEKGQSSVHMMQGYIGPELQRRIKISFNKQSSSKLKLFGQVSGVHHQKIALFDDTLIIGGANLSFNYFVNRKDRYLKFQECGPLTDYLYEYLQVLQENCCQLDEMPARKGKGNLEGHYKLWKYSYTPDQYKDIFRDQEAQLDRKAKQKAAESERKIRAEPTPKIPKDRNIVLSQMLGSDIKEYEQVPEEERKQRIDRTRDRLFTIGDENDVGNCLMDIEDLKDENQISEVGEKVYIFPFMQFPALKQTLEPQVLSRLLQNSVENKLPIRISSGYMNFTKQILQILSQSEKPTVVLCSAPQANSFYRGGTIKKYIPYFYRNFEGQILEKWPQKFTIKQYFNGKWSFHAKGIWIKQAENSYITVVGSSNFNRRSKERDSELQLYLYSTCEKFNGRLEREWTEIERDCKEVGLETIKGDSEIRYNWFFNWVSKVVSRFL